MTTPPTTRTGRIVILSGPSGSGKSRLAARLSARYGWPVVGLDDFYRNGDDPELPIQEELGIPDWDDPRAWDGEAAVDALTRLVTTGRTDTPVYDISTSTAVDTREVVSDGRGLILAEGIFAGEIVPTLRSRGLLHSAWCVRHRRGVTFALRLARDLRERRKPPATLVKRGILLMREAPRVIARDVLLGCRAARAREVERALTPSD